MYGVKIACTDQVSFGPVPVLKVVKIIWNTAFIIKIFVLSIFGGCFRQVYCILQIGIKSDCENWLEAPKMASTDSNQRGSPEHLETMSLRKRVPN